LKYTSIDIDVRITCDYIFFKAQGMAGLPSELHWCYRYLDPFGIQNMPRDAFVVLTKAGSLGFGEFPKVEWHKEEGESILQTCGIDVEHTESMQPTTKERIGDLEHAKWMEGLLEGKTRMELKGSWHESYVTHEKERHNASIQRIGECERCRRAQSKVLSTIIP
jgi:hypothetical protein